MVFTSGSTVSAGCEDAKILARVQKRLLAPFGKLGTWRKVAAELGINHGYVSMVMRISATQAAEIADIRVRLARLIPSNVEVRAALELPKVLPSERKVRVKRIIPVMGSEGWERIFFKRSRPRRWRVAK